MLLSVRDLVTSFRTSGGRVTAVDGVSFDVAAGETLAIVGESGSGKTVTALSILRLVPDPPGSIESGQVVFDGQDLLAASDEAMRALRGNRIAMIFQEPMTSLNPTLTVGMQVGEPLNQHRALRWPQALQRAKELLGLVRIPDSAARVSAYSYELSGGMRQRAMIAMALACEPQLVIADEPTTALDVTVQAQILDLLADLARRAKAALILITHDLGVVARYADRVAVMYAGRIVEEASAAELYANPRHPYTRALLALVPRLDADVTVPPVPIEGQPPDLAALPPGCAFAPRCRHAGAACRAARPRLHDVAPGHRVACVLEEAA